MSGEKVDFERPDAEPSDGKREQSTITFPYLDLDAAAEVANAIYQRAGLGGCQIDELAAEMGQVISGAFRLKTGTAKIFGLTEKDGRGALKLSELGRQLVSPDTERAARIEAFMRVPLYAAIYEKYKGHLLPPMKALEREMQSLGVSSKQTDKARQAFERSAKQAGYFENGDDRLVRPRGDLPTKKTENDPPFPLTDSGIKNDVNQGNRGGGGSGGGGTLPPDKNHPLIQGLLLTLPEPGKPWDADARASWLRMAASIFDMIYEGPSAPITITVGPAIKKAATDQ